MAITNMNELCRLCLDESEMLYKLDSDFCILVMESGASVTIADAMKYLDMDVKIPAEKADASASDENEDDPEEKRDEESEEPKPVEDDDPNLPKSLCQECLEKLQSAYEFKFRCDENKTFLRNYLKECADSKLAEERAAKDAALLALDLDVDNLDNLPDKLVLKQIKKEKRPRKPRDPTKAPQKRRRRIPEKNIIIAEDSQVETAAYIRKIVTTPEQSPEQKHSNKRKSKHVIIEDVMIGDKASKKSAAKAAEEKKEVTEEKKEVTEEEKAATEVEVPRELPTKKVTRGDDEPVFEDDDDFEDEPVKKKTRRAKK